MTAGNSINKVCYLYVVQLAINLCEFKSKCLFNNEIQYTQQIPEKLLKF